MLRLATRAAQIAQVCVSICIWKGDQSGDHPYVCVRACPEVCSALYVAASLSCCTSWDGLYPIIYRPFSSADISTCHWERSRGVPDDVPVINFSIYTVRQLFLLGHVCRETGPCCSSYRSISLLCSDPHLHPPPPPHIIPPWSRERDHQGHSKCSPTLISVTREPEGLWM